MSSKATSLFKDPGIAETMSIHNKYAVIPADKVSSNIVLIAESITLTVYYIIRLA